MNEDQAPAANTESEIAAIAGAFARNVWAQMADAQKAGVDSKRDHCIVLPAGYLALIFHMPMLELDGKRVAVCTLNQAEALVRTLERESGWSAR